MMTTVEYVKVEAIFEKANLTDDDIQYLIQNWDDMKLKSYYKGLCFYSKKRIPTHYVEYWGRNAEGKMLFLWDTTSDHTSPSFEWVEPENAVKFIKGSLWMGGIRVMTVPILESAYEYWGIK